MLAQHIARGVSQDGEFEARLRTVPEISSITSQSASSIPDSGAVYCSKEDLADCSALVLGSPTRFGNMSGALKHFLDDTADLWMQNALVGKPAAVFTSTNSMHGGQESTLLTMMVPLFHHGMIIMGVPYSEPTLRSTTSGGTPYGPTHVSASPASGLSGDEQTIAQALGKRIASVAGKLN